MIEAAGGVIWRTCPDHGLEVLLIHRTRERDWSLPKGKLYARETALDGALREVREETGLRCDPGPELPATQYLDRKGRAKRVRYWAMQAVSGRFRPNAEVARVEWHPLHAALVKLTAARDIPVVAALDELFASVV